MAAIDQIVKVTITQQTQSVTQAGFGIPFILGPTGFGNSDKFRYYSEASAMLEDGFSTSDAEYIHAVALTSQALSPITFGVGKSAPGSYVAQIDTATPVAANDALYRVTIDDTNYDFTSDSSATATEIVTGLKALINADAFAEPAATGSTTLILTAKNAGAAFSTSVSSNLTLVHTTPNTGVADDIAAIQNISDVWYGLVNTSKTASTILATAAYVETQKKIYITSTNDVDGPTSNTGDLLSILKGRGYKRTATMYSQSPSDGPDAAWLGGQLPQTPGASTWKFKQLVGIDPDTYTDTQRQFLIGNPLASIVGKNANIYETIGGANITREGTMSSGQFIDLTIGIDWLQSTMQTNVYSLLVQSAKIPYTDQGASVVENAVRQTLRQGVANGLIDGASPITVTIPPVLSQTTGDRAARILAGVKFGCRLAGALHSVVIDGSVTV